MATATAPKTQWRPPKRRDEPRTMYRIVWRGELGTHHELIAESALPEALKILRYAHGRIVSCEPEEVPAPLGYGYDGPALEHEP